MGVGLGFGFGPLRFYIPLSGGRRRRRAKYWTHAGCTIHHRSQDAANRCRVGRAPAASSVRPPATAPAPAARRNLSDRSPLDKFMIAAYVVIDSGAAEPAGLMRQLGLPFVEIDRIVQGLEKYGVVSPFDRGTRKVLVTRDGFNAAMKSRWAEVRADFS